MERNKWIQVVRPPDIEKAMNFLKQPQGLFGPAQVEMVLHLDLARVGKNCS